MEIRIEIYKCSQKNSPYTRISGGETLRVYFAEAGNDGWRQIVVLFN
jgi:hypothetical protein